MTEEKTEGIKEGLYNKLLTATQKALKAQNVEESIHHLAEAFQLFSKESNRLNESYQALKKRFENVNLDLETSNLELRKNIKELKSVSAYLANILKNTNQGILFIDTSGLIITHNQAALKILEKKESELSFKNYFQEFPDDYFGFSMTSALALGSSPRESYLSFDEKQIEISTSFVSDAPKPYQGLIVFLKDITEITQLHEDASRSDRLKEIGQIATTVAHEIKNPLGGIRGFAALLYRDLEHKKPLQEMAEHIIEGTKTLERLVSSILHFTRPVCLQVEKVNLSKLIKDLIKLIKVDPSFSEEISLECHVPNEVLFAYIDKELFKSALLNLVRNALEAIEGNGHISISLIKNNDNSVIDINDSGIGMDDQELENLFSPFFTTKEKGNGLGLAEAYKIITAHMGKVQVRSAKGMGTTFTIILPSKKG